ncbi:ferric reductase like transmembrane component-domain-containing protein [Pisolithus marmoratus]|nr:ferric reductase like transmembrane component-domain-containing protein [Pisolithus marmoratus]
MSNTTTDSAETVDAVGLVFHVDLLILAVAAVFALATLPRAFARFSRGTEWQTGYILRSTRLDYRQPRRPPPLRSPPTPAEKPTPMPPEEPHVASSAGHEAVTSEESHTCVSHTQLIRRPSTRKAAAKLLPPHVRSWSAVLPPVGNLLRYRLDSGFSLGQALVLGLYSAILVYPVFFQSEPFTDPLRTGFVAMSQIPLVYLLATKNNLLGMILAVGYEKLNYIHRYAGMVLVLLSNVHTLGYIYEWASEGQLAAELKMPQRMWGLVALVALDIIYFFSTPFWRSKAYNIFFGSHIICFIIFLPTVYAHQPVVLPYVLAAAAAYGLDHILRLLKTRLFHGRIRPIPDLSMTRIEIPELNAGWRPGQHVRIRVLSTAMGWIGWAEVHPFTMASVVKTPEGLVLLCKNVGGWTRKLYEMAKVAGYGSEDGGMSRSVLIMVEGPYGGPGHSVFASYSAAMFIVGGSGITFALSALQNLVRVDLEGASRVKVIELVWCVQDPSSLTPLLPQFTALLQQSTYTPLHITVHYTRAAETLPSKASLPPGITLTAGRPRIGKVLDAVLQRTMSYGSGVKASMDITGVIVGVCGPVGLGDEVAQVVSSVDPSRRWAVGGIEIHEE